MFGYAQLIPVVLHVWGPVVEPTSSRPESMPPAMPRGIPVSYYNSMNNHTTKMRMPNTHIFLSRSAIKYAVNIYQRLPNNTSREWGGRSLTEHDHWGIWWLPDLTNSYQVRACAEC